MAGLCAIRCTKGLLLLLNLLYWTSGLFLLFIGLWILLSTERNELLNLLLAARSDFVQLLSLLCLTVGGVVLGVGVTGTLGAVREKKGYLAAAIVLLIVCLSMGSLVCALLIRYQPYIVSNLRSSLHSRLVADYGREGNNLFTMAMDYTQYKFTCCGIESPKDYQDSLNDRWRWKDVGPSSNTKLSVPRTCCRLLNYQAYLAWKAPQPENHSSCQSTHVEQYAPHRYSQGCFERMREWLFSKTLEMMAIGGALIFIQVVSIILTICLCRNLDKRIQSHFV